MKPPADLRKETMRITLPPRAGAAPAATAPKPAAAAGMPAQPAKTMAAPVAGSTPKPAMGGTVPAVKSGGAVAVRAVDVDGGGTGLAVVALLASLAAFGIVLFSFLSK